MLGVMSETCPGLNMSPQEQTLMVLKKIGDRPRFIKHSCLSCFFRPSTLSWRDLLFEHLCYFCRIAVVSRHTIPIHSSVN